MTQKISNFDRFRRWFTFRRVFPYAFLLMIFALAVRQCAFIDPDLWWHLQTGQDIVSSGAIPRVDPYSFTRNGAEWITHEWLSEVFIYAIYAIGGWGGMVTVFSALITLALFITYRRCEGKPYFAAIAILLAAASSSPLFGIRPQMITFLLASVYLALLSQFKKEGRSGVLWWLAPLMLLWVNFHAGYALGLGLIALFLAGSVLDGEWQRIRPLALALFVCALLVPINPHGLRMFSYPLETLTSPSMAAFIEEWASPNFHELMYLPLALMLFGLLIALALSPKRPLYSELLLLFVTGFAALRSGRHIPIFALIAAPILAKHLWSLMVSRGWEKPLRPTTSLASPFAIVLNLALLGAPATLCVARVTHLVMNQREYEAKNYPAAAVDFMVQEKPPGPIYNRYGWGGYLIRRLYPEYQVYIDGRADLYGDAFMVEAMKTHDGHPAWKSALDKRSIQTVLLTPNAPLSSLLRLDQEWQRIYEDRQAIIFTKKPQAESVASDPPVESELALVETHRKEAEE